MKKKIISVSAVACMLLNTVTSINTLNIYADDEPTEKINILTLGDSITDGYWTAGGYRKYLYHELDKMGYSDKIDMVGAKGSNNAEFTYNGETVSYDDNYSGYSGYAIQRMTSGEYREGILETIQGTYFEGGKNMISAYNPDIVLLQIGTNDVLSGYNDGITERLENLVNVILDDMNEPTDILYVSTIPDIDAIMRADWLGAYGINAWASTDEEKQQLMKTVQGYIDSYNQSIYDMVVTMQREGKQVKFADINSVVDYKEDLYDGVHPNEQGYEKMGKYWASVIDSQLKGNNTEPPATTTETTTTTITTTETKTTTITNITSISITTNNTESSTAETTTSTTTTEPIIPEKKYTIADAIKLLDYLLCRYEIQPEDEFDINSDGNINVFDLIEIKNIIRNQ